MADVARLYNTIAAMSDTTIGQVRALESAAQALPQTPLETEHVFHAGMYARTVRIPADTLITGALIQIPTILIVSGNAIMYGDDGPVPIAGYRVFAASAGRKQAFLAIHETHLTMLFPTAAKTVAEAEDEFTAEADLLMTRAKCPA